jgi:hypothetical protein
MSLCGLQPLILDGRMIVDHAVRICQVLTSTGSSSIQNPGEKRGLNSYYIFSFKNSSIMFQRLWLKEQYSVCMAVSLQT